MVCHTTLKNWNMHLRVLLLRYTNDINSTEIYKKNLLIIYISRCKLLNIKLNNFRSNDKQKEHIRDQIFTQRHA